MEEPSSDRVEETRVSAGGCLLRVALWGGAGLLAGMIVALVVVAID